MFTNLFLWQAWKLSRKDGNRVKIGPSLFGLMDLQVLSTCEDGNPTNKEAEQNYPRQNLVAMR